MDEPRRKIVLVVDDEPEIVTGLAAILQADGYAVLTASDGEEALAKAKAERPDVIIADLMLPKLDGWRVCQQLKLDPQYRHIPFIMLSGLIREPSDLDEMSLGDALLPKPCSATTLLALVQDVLTRTRTTPPA